MPSLSGLICEQYQGVIPEIDYPDVPANLVVMAALGGGLSERHGYFSFAYWMAGSSPAMAAEPKFGVDSMVSSLSGNVGDPSPGMCWPRYGFLITSKRFRGSWRCFGPLLLNLMTVGLARAQSNAQAENEANGTRQKKIDV
jgi:hypothetical protein